MASVGEIKARLVLDSRQFTKNLDDSTQGLKKTTKSAQETKKAITEIQKASLIMGTAVVGAIGASVKAAANFEQGMANVKAVSGATGDEMKKLSALAMEMGEKTSFSASDAAAGIEELIKAGVTVTDIMDGGLKGALDLAVAGNLELADSAEIASTVLNAFKADGLSVSDAANILAGAANASATEVGELKYGLSMVSAVASGAGLSFEDTSTALATFAQNGLKGSDAGTSLKTMLMNLSPATEGATEQMFELGIMAQDGSNAFYDAEGNLKSLAEITDVLHQSLKDLNPRERGDALKQMFGTDAIRAGTILFKEGADGINKMNEAMSKVTAAEVAATKLDTLKGKVEEFTSVLETVGIQIGTTFLPALTDIVKGATSVLDVFGEVDPATVSVGLKMAATATGIALVTSTVLKLGLSLKTLMVSMGPAGWVIGGLSILGGLLVGVTDGYGDMNKVSLETVNSMTEQHDALSSNIDQFDELRNNCQLSSDELGRFVDINSELAKTANPDVIKRLKEEQEGLTQKSGLSNSELDKMVSLNEDIIAVVPESSTKLTEQGNVLLDNTKKAKKYNSEQMELIRLELEAQQAKAEANINENLAEETRLKKEINTLSEKRAGIEKKIGDEQAYIAEQTRLLNKAKEDGNEQGELFHKNEISLHEAELELLKDKNSKLASNTLEKSKSLEEVRKEIKSLEEVKNKMVDIELKQVGINAKRGQEISQIESAVGKLESNKQKLIETTPVAQRNTQEYRNAVAEIQKQIDNLNTTKSRVEEIIGKAQELNTSLGQTVYKNVFVSTDGKYRPDLRNKFQPLNPNYHTGGLVGQNAINQMPKLHTGGMPYQVANTPMHNEIDVRLLRNEMVLTEPQQANLLKMIDAGHTNQMNTPAQKVEKNLNVDVVIQSPTPHSLYDEKRKFEQVARKLLHEF